MYRNYTHLFFSFAVMSSLFFLSCKATKVVEVPVEKMAFYTLKVNRDTIKKETTFSVASVQVADAKLNYKLDTKQAKNPDFLKIEIIDKNERVISVLTEHPLFKRFDLYSESGEIESKSISLQQGEVTFRVPYYTDYKTIKITETINFKQSKQIILKHEK